MKREALVVVSATGGIGGPSRSLLGLLQQLEGELDRTLISPEGHLARAALEFGLVEHHVSIPRWRRLHPVARVLAALRIALWLIRHRAEIGVVHANGEAEVNLVGFGVLLARLDLVVSARAFEIKPWVRRVAPIWKWALPRARWVAVSEHSRDLVLSAHLVRPEQIVVVPNPVATKHVRADRVVSSGKVRIGFLGGKGYDKGFDLIPDVIRELGRTDVTWQLFTSQPGEGGTPMQRQTWRRIEDLREQGFDIRHFGKLADVREAYARCDIVFSPSRRESFGRIPVEAMANGIPVVASDIPTFIEFIEGHDAGLLFRSGDVAAAAEQLGVLIDDADRRRQVGEAGMRRAEDFAPGPIGERFLAIYRSGSAREVVG